MCNLIGMDLKKYTFTCINCKKTHKYRLNPNIDKTQITFTFLCFSCWKIAHDNKLEESNIKYS